MYYLEFNEHRNYDLGIKVVKRPIIPNPKKKKREVDIPGADGTLHEILGGYENIIIPVEFNFMEKKCSLKQTFRNIKSWINNIKDNKLIFSDDLEYFYEVVDVNMDSFETILRRKGIFIIEFTCKPHMYYQGGEEITEITNKTTLYNLFGEESKPLIYIEGHGEASIKVNDSTCVVAVADYVYIDSDLELAYREKDDPFNLLEGDFPILESGENTISYTGNVTKFEIQPRWRCL